MAKPLPPPQFVSQTPAWERMFPALKTELEKENHVRSHVRAHRRY